MLSVTLSILMSSERVLDLADEFFRLARHRVPLDWLRTDLTMPQLKVLYTLYIDGPQACGALASTQGLSLPTMTGILARLERRGYLRRRRDSRDSRRVVSSLSRRGSELVDRLWASGREELAAVLDDIPAEELMTIEQALTSLIEALERSQSVEGHPARVPNEETLGSRT
jgi:DNA-binding MarR family transcriptional regulator